jgi:hypothetical protein
MLASQETAGPSSQRFSVETLWDEPGNFGDEIEAVISFGGANLGCEVLENILWVEQDATVGGEKGASEVVVPGAKAQKLRVPQLSLLILMNLMTKFMMKRLNMTVFLVFLSLLSM